MEFITRYIASHGYEPSYQQIAWHLGVRSKAGIAKHIAALENQGLITRKRENGSFNLEIRGSDPAAESVCRIDWLDAPTAAAPSEEWETRPIFVPVFLLGFYDPVKIRAFRVPDDAMLAKNIVEGDVALIEQRSFVRDGDCVAAVVDKKRTVLNNYYRAGAYIELRPASERFTSIRLPADKIEVLGIFRGLLRMIL